MLPTSTTRSTARDYARPPMTAVLYAIPASHPCAVVERALQLKERPVPARRADPRRCTGCRSGCASAGRPCRASSSTTARASRGSRAILRALEERAPEPPLLPADRRRARARRARGGVGRPGAAAARPARRLGRRCGARRARWMSYTRGRAAARARGRSRGSARRWWRGWPQVGQRRERPDVRADLLALPGHLDRVDRWIADGTLGGATVERGRPADRREPAAAAHRRATSRPRSTTGPRARSRGACSRPTRGDVPAGTLPAALAARALRRLRCRTRQRARSTRA